MIIHVYLSEEDTKGKENLLLNGKELETAFQNEQEEIHTTQIYAISLVHANKYDYIFHYKGEEETISKAEMGQRFYDCIGEMYTFYSEKAGENKNVNGRIFRIGWENLQRDNAEKVTSSLKKYIPYRLKEILRQEKLYALQIILLMFTCFALEINIVFRILYGICVVLIMTSTERNAFTMTKAQTFK